ncbi:hypothetical protein AS034_16255 [[Bacillus] enclensis]|uniref:Dolichyl-phosphate-mannose-protein mannosyltransferase n=1 Tax=[Bacillus] enclensis TaxID=1402860 RepID=A0A0V8HCY6_9BACI|nr:hypothetical protein [[Bacillus] enclensis]KSU60393.1 hypothetical protein AS034_16255 [[Bacillus] enclensis]SCC24006.1 hypothetical protein GA0061094_3362 [[Bacillus] enclensis]
MLLVWLFFIIELLIVFIFKDVFSQSNIVGLILVILNLPFLIFTLGLFRGKIRLILLLGLFSRMSLMFIDIFAKGVITLPHSGNDTEGFYHHGIAISQNISLLQESIYGGIYSKFLGVLFFIVGDQRIVAQYFNVLVSLSTIMIVYKILKEFNVSDKVKTVCLILITFFPQALIFSSILLREAIITFLVVTSFYYFFKWYKVALNRYFFLSLIILLIGASFHSGVIGIIIGYFFVFLFIRRQSLELAFTPKSIFLFIILLFFVLSLSVIPLDSIPFMNKFSNRLTDSSDIYGIAEGSNRGGAAYLNEITINNPFQLILYAPIKMFYFIGSPFPWNWRNIFDVLSFVQDSLIYLMLFLYPILNFKKLLRRDPLIMGTFIMLLSVIFIFGIGVSNAGTALRHRYKIFHLLILFFAFVITTKKNKGSKGMVRDQ